MCLFNESGKMKESNIFDNLQVNHEAFRITPFNAASLWHLCSRSTCFGSHTSSDIILEDEDESLFVHEINFSDKIPI
jgi:hypothetical protein